MALRRMYTHSPSRLSFIRIYIILQWEFVEFISVNCAHILCILFYDIFEKILPSLPEYFYVSQTFYNILYVSFVRL